jgi:alcohol dehydrogenase class IV
MNTFLFSMPTRVIFGPGCVVQTGTETAAAGSHALLVTGGTFARRSGLLDHIERSLTQAGVAFTRFDGVETRATVAAIDEGGAEAKRVGADVVVGIGGGSALDAAKGIAVVAAAGPSIWDYTRHRADEEPRPVTQALPTVQVPIIASTGSETNDTTVILNERERIRAPISGPCLFARSAIVDPSLTFTVPARFTGVGAMNIVSQMLESYLTSDEFAPTDRVTEGVMRTVMDSLPRALRRSEDLDARSNLSWASALATSVALAGRENIAPLRAMAHPITAHFDVDHGSVVAALWPSYMRYALSNRFRLPQIGRYKRYALLGRQVFGVHETDDEVAAEITAHRFQNWLRASDIPVSLHALGITELPVEQLAEEAVLVSGNGKRLPGGLSAADIEHIYEGALRS